MALGDDPLWLAHLLALMATALTQLLLAAWVYRRQWSERGAKTFLVMTLTGLAWTSSEMVLVAGTDPLVQEVAYMSGAFWVTVTVSAFVVFASQYANAGLHRNRLVQATLGSMVVGYAVLAPTNRSHHLLFEPFTPATEPFPYIMYERGPAFSIVVLVLSLLAIYSIYRMGRYLLSTRHRAGSQLALLMAGALSLLTLEVLSNLGVMPLERYTYAVYGMLPFNLFTGLAVFRFSLLDVQPVARSSVVENLRDPVLVLDDGGNLVDYNHASTHVWPAIDDGMGGPLAAACPTLADRIDLESTADDANSRLLLPYDGRDRHYSVTVSSMGRRADDDGGGDWYTILLRDVTEIERSRQQLETQNERLDQVASTLSHDLRNPLQVAEGNIRLVREFVADLDVDPESRENALNDVDSTRDALDRMGAILDDVLTMAREGKTVQETEVVSLAAVATDAWENVETKAATLTINGDRRFAADRSKLLRIFENLFRNGLDHGRPDVTIEVDATGDGFAVADDGPGIPADEVDEVFEYGYTTRESGTGLGLSIVETMAESHGWSVHVDPQYADGARFVFESVRTSPNGSHDDGPVLHRPPGGRVGPR